MSASGLRKEWARGRLVVFKIAGKTYTTLLEIEKMWIASWFVMTA